MPKPVSKKELLNQSEENFTDLLNYIEYLGAEEQTAEFPEGMLNRNISDVLMHLHHWHLLVMEWYDLGAAGQHPQKYSSGYSKKDRPELNRQIWQRYRDVNLRDALRNVRDSHFKIMELINLHSDEELFTKKYYNWTGTTSLAYHFTLATSRHYEWALKLIRKARKG